MRLTATNLAAHRQGRLLFGGLDFELESGQSLQVRGCNGSGKSTFLRVLAGLTRPTRGTLNWTPQGPLVFVGHQDGCRGDLSVRQNLHLIALLAGVPLATKSEHEILVELGLEHQSDTPVRRLSQGQRRRVALSRLCLGAERPWILDEPTTALDATARAWLEGRLQRHVDAGGVVIVSSHGPLDVGAPTRILELGG